jgi:hypothetical protein
MIGNSTNTKNSKVLSPVQLQAVQFLAGGMASKEIAKKLDIHPSTISVWKNIPEFESCLNVLLREYTDDCKERLLSLGSIALETIQSVMEDKEGPAKERLAAALKIVDMLGINTPAFKQIGKPDPNPLFADDPFMNLPDMNEKLILKDLEIYLKSVTNVNK